MSTLLYSLGRWAFRHPWRVLVAWLLILGIAAGGVALLARGTDNSFSIPGTEAQAGLQQLNRTFPQASGTSAQLIVVAADGERVDATRYTAAIAGTVSRIEGLERVLAVTDPFGETVDGLVSDDAAAAIVRLQFDGTSTDVPAETKSDLRAVAADLRDELPAGSQVALGGDLFSSSVPTLSIIEAVGLLIALVVLVVTFRSFVVAGMPLITAIIGVALSMALIFVATAFASVSSTTPLLALMLGLAVGIDYALFIIARHQDQVRSGMAPEESAARANGTAGSAVVFAGVTVLIALIGLGFANIPFLTTMGIAASAAVAIAVLVALTLTPAFLGLAKGRVVGWRRRLRSATQAPVPDPVEGSAAATASTPVPEPVEGSAAQTPVPEPVEGSATAAGRPGLAHRWIIAVTRHPVVTTVAVIVTLGVMAIPAGSLALALPNAGMLPEESEARQSYDLVSEHFGPGFNGPLIMTGTIVTSNDPLTLMRDLGDEIAQIPGVRTVALATPNETADTGIVQLIPETAPDDPATTELVRELRAQHDRLLAEYGVDLKVTGFTAVAIDISDRLGSALLPFGVFVVGLSLILLTVVFRSIWVPIKAALGYLLSVAAAFGVVAAVFEWGWGAELLHVSKTGPVISFMPIVLMGVLFGLAMDYEVFLVSRMREEFVHMRRARNARSAGEAEARAIAIQAIRTGYTASARVVTAAAVIMFAVFAAFVPEGDSSLKPIALGLASGILIDAFLVRMTLVPAVMTLLGARAWWMPAWLDRRLPSLDIEGEAIERELALADWPEPRTTAAVVAAQLTLSERPDTLYDDVSLRVDPGDALVVTASDARRSRALLLTIAGRIAPTDGRLKVAGQLLPGRAAGVRSRVGVALLAGATDPLDELRQALSGSTRIVVIDGLDAVAGGAANDQAAATLRDAALVLRQRRQDLSLAPLTVIASATDTAAAQRVLADAGWPDAPVLAVTAAPSRRAHARTLTTEEVTA